MAETSPKGINKTSFSIKQMPYRKGFCYSKTKRFCENKMKAGQKGKSRSYRVRSKCTFEKQK